MVTSTLQRMGGDRLPHFLGSPDQTSGKAADVPSIGSFADQECKLFSQELGAQPPVSALPGPILPSSPSAPVQQELV